jgi:hypothetical protein
MSRLLRGLELWGKGGSGIPLVGTPLHSVPSPSLFQYSPAAGWWLKGPECLLSHWGLQKCGNIVSDTQRSRELRSYFMLAVAYELTLKILGPHQ